MTPCCDECENTMMMDKDGWFCPYCIMKNKGKLHEKL